MQYVSYIVHLITFNMNEGKKVLAPLIVLDMFDYVCNNKQLKSKFMSLFDISFTVQSCFIFVLNCPILEILCCLY